jgi:hypothetical protein
MGSPVPACTAPPCNLMNPLVRSTKPPASTSTAVTAAGVHMDDGHLPCHLMSDLCRCLLPFLQCAVLPAAAARAYGLRAHHAQPRHHCTETGGRHPCNRWAAALRCVVLCCSGMRVAVCAGPRHSTCSWPSEFWRHSGMRSIDCIDFLQHVWLCSERHGFIPVDLCMSINRVCQLV